MLHARAQGLLAALAAAATFGAVNVAVRHALDDGLQPLWAVALAYLSGGLAMLPWARRAKLDRADRKRMATSIVAGAVVAPILLFFGLQRTAAGTASLALNLEMAFTALFALTLLGETLRRWDAAGTALLAAAALLVSVAGGLGGASSAWGILLVSLAALGWAVDNTASTPLAQKHDPRALIARKTTLGGLVVIAAALLFAGPPGGAPLDWVLAASAGLVGVAFSSVLFYFALGRIGAARTTVVFATSGLWGFVLATWLLHEPFTLAHAASVALCLLGIGALARGHSVGLK